MIIYKITRLTTLPLTALLLARPATPQQGGPERQVMVTTETEAYFVAPPELVAGPIVQTLAMSTDGRYLLVARSSLRITQQLVQGLIARKIDGPPPGETSLVLWDNKTRTAREVWKGDMRTVSVESLHWLGDSEAGLALIRETLPPTPQNPQSEMRQGLLRISSLGTRAQVLGLTDLEKGGYLYLHVSPVEPLAILQHDNFNWREETTPDGKKRGFREGHRTLYLLRQDGRLGASIQLPKELELGTVVWSQTGDPLLNVMQVVDKKASQRWFSIDRRTAALKPVEQPQNLYQPKPPAEMPVRLKSTQMAAKEGETTQQVSMLWLEGAPKSEAPRGLISADSPGGSVLPKGDGIIYYSQGALWTAPLVKMPKEAFLAARAAAERARILSNGKQLGLAAMMYAQDYDEVLPTPDNINTKLEPYLKNSSLFEGFSYTFAGGPLSGVDKPAETELGYVLGPGGRAVIYVDGHVKWRPDGP